MLPPLKGLLALVVAALAALSTYASVGRVHLTTGPQRHSAAVQQPASTEVGNVAGDLNTSTPPLPMPTPTPEPVAEDDAASPAAGGSTPVWQAAAPPVSRPVAPPPPQVVVGSAQQSYINADRAAAGLPPLSWSPCLASIAAGQSAAMAAQGQIFHGSGVSQDFGCGLGSTRTGENVGYWSAGVNDAQLNTMFMNSPEHRANIMGGYRYVGTAWVVGKNGAGYITVEFA